MSADQDFYKNGVPEHSIARAHDEIAWHYDTWLKDRTRWYGNRNGIRVLELGAGTCTISTLLSRESWIGEIVAADISLPRMDLMRPHAMERFDGDASKVRCVEANFNDPLNFPDGYFDLVVMDGALHHSRALWDTVAEIHRVLKRHGHFVAQREQFVAPLTAGIKLRRLLRTDEVMQGVSENAYLKDQYDYYLRANGFRVRFIPVLPSWVFKALRFLNGAAFSKFTILATKTGVEARPVVDRAVRLFRLP